MREILFRGFCPNENGKQIITLDGEDIEKKIPLYERYKRFSVSAESLEDFCNKYHRPFESSKFGQEQRAEWLENAKRELKRHGYVVIPEGTTISGLTVTYYGEE